jgi:hypothetical protein
MIMWRRVACCISKATRAQAHARSRAPTPTHVHARAQISNIYYSSTATMVSSTRLYVNVEHLNIKCSIQGLPNIKLWAQDALLIGNAFLFL